MMGYPVEPEKAKGKEEKKRGQDTRQVKGQDSKQVKVQVPKEIKAESRDR